MLLAALVLAAGVARGRPARRRPRPPAARRARPTLRRCTSSCWPAGPRPSDDAAAAAARARTRRRARSAVGRAAGRAGRIPRPPEPAVDAVAAAERAVSARCRVGGRAPHPRAGQRRLGRRRRRRSDREARPTVARRGDRAPHAGAEHAGDGHRSRPADDAGAAAARRRPGRQGRAAARAGGGADRRPASRWRCSPTRTARSDSSIAPRRCSSRPPRRIRATTWRSATSTSGSDKFEEAAAAFEKGVEGHARARAASCGCAAPRRCSTFPRAPAPNARSRRSPSSSRPIPKDVTGLHLLAQAHQQRGDDRPGRARRRAGAGRRSRAPAVADRARRRSTASATTTPRSTRCSRRSTPTRRRRRGGALGRDRAPAGRARRRAPAARRQRRRRSAPSNARARLLPESRRRGGGAGAGAPAGPPVRPGAVASPKTRAVTSADDVGLIRVEAIAGVRAGRAAEAVGASSARLAQGHRPEAAFALADVYQEAKRHDDGDQRCVDALAAAAPDDDAIAFRLAAAYESADRVPDAERVFRAIVARDPLHANALNYLGYMLANRGLRLTEALTLIDRALVVEPGNPAFLDSRGWALLQARPRRRRRGAAAHGRRRAARQLGDPVALRRRAGRARQARRGRRPARTGAGRRRRGRRSRRARTAAAAARPPRPMSGGAA